MVLLASAPFFSRQPPDQSTSCFDMCWNTRPRSSANAHGYVLALSMPLYSHANVCSPPDRPHLHFDNVLVHLGITSCKLTPNLSGAVIVFSVSLLLPLKTSRVLLLTTSMSPAHPRSRGSSVEHGCVWGLARVMRVEQTSTTFISCDAVSYTHLTLPTKRIV